MMTGPLMVRLGPLAVTLGNVALMLSEVNAEKTLGLLNDERLML